MSASDSPKPSKDRESDAAGESAGGGESASAHPQPRLPVARGPEVTSDEQKKLEDIRRKLKDIFVTGEKAPAPKEETIKPAEQQTASSGLLDLRDLAKQRQAGKEAEQRVDDDMLFLSGGLFNDSRGPSSSFGPPDISQKAPPAPKPPPPVQAVKPSEVVEIELDEPEPADGDAKPRPKKLETDAVALMTAPVTAPVATSESDEIALPKSALSGRTIALLAIAFVGLLGIVFYVTMHAGNDDADANAPARTGTDTATTATAGSDVKPVEPPQQPTTTPADSQPANVVAPGDKAAASASASSKPEASASAAKTADKPGSKEPATGPATGPAPTGPKPEGPAPTQATAPAPPPETAKPAPPPPPPAAEEFNQSAARAALSAAAARAASCKSDGPGSASVSITFAPSGRVTSAKVEGGTFAGTPTGGCIATAFRGASVPPFDGSPVTVKKNVSIR